MPLPERIDFDFDTEPIGFSGDNTPVFLKDIWPSQEEVNRTVNDSIDAEMFRRQYSTVSDGDNNWQKGIRIPLGDVYGWEPDSTYIRKAPYFDGMPAIPAPVQDIHDARVLAVLGDSVTTDHISPAGSIKLNGPAGKYLTDNGVKPGDFNSYGSRRGNHEVMVRGTFANVRLRNKLAPGTEGGVTRLLPEGTGMSIYDASVEYAKRGTPLAILAGKEYGSGSSRDWAAKGPRLLGIRFVLAESYERIHRSNLVGMGILPLQFQHGDNAESLQLTGEETYSVPGLKAMLDSKFAMASRLPSKQRAPTARSSAYPQRFVSTRRRRSSTTGTAASCNTCCGNWQARRSSLLLETTRPGAIRAFVFLQTLTRLNSQRQSHLPEGHGVIHAIKLAHE